MISQTQYNQLISDLLNEKCALAKLRTELEGKRGKLCRCCKGFGHLTRNYRNKKKEEKETIISQNKFKILKSKVIQYGVEERTIRRHKAVVAECFKCGEKEHKCKECLLWEKRKRVVHAARPQKVY